jgi:hypothetical protein
MRSMVEQEEDHTENYREDLFPGDSEENYGCRYCATLVQRDEKLDISRYFWMRLQLRKNNPEMIQSVLMVQRNEQSLG